MKSRNFANLNVNPCKMCMPMGAVTAFKGIEECMVMLHGSQGCSTYIRRHMAEHYNEPIDIGSSSLSEEGTVYGGEENLKKGLKNLIKVYNPAVIGVATTCLAETIGEDIKRYTQEFTVEEGLVDNIIIPVSTPGYGGTQFEGYYAAILEVVKTIAADNRSTGKINIIPGVISPGDARNIKRILDLFGVDYIFLPDISDTLDAPFNPDFQKIPKGGTRVSDIRKMAGSCATIEMGLTLSDNLSPGKFLLNRYGVPLYKCSIPIGIKYTDLFVNILAKISGKPVPESIKLERGRLIDGMVDSHKYNGEGRAAIYGEPEQCIAVGRLCLENGIKPVLISTGSKNQAVADIMAQDLGDADIKIIDDTDFDTIRSYSKELKANIAIGNSDGKVITEKEGIPLVRIGFPIHDRVGGQRLVYTGYDGTMRLLDDITNTLLDAKHSSYRENMYKKYFSPKEEPKREKKIDTHPCFGSASSQYARMHIPIAPACNISCNYCNRKYDCVNESRPGVTSEILTPQEAADKFEYVKSKINNLTVVGIAGPGDALANFENTKKAIQLIREKDKDITFCLSTNGLMLPHYVDEIAELGVSHLTVTINATDPAIGAMIYKEVNYMGRKLTGREAAEVLLKNQLDGLKKAVEKGITCKVNIVMLKGINDRNIESVVKAAKECGACMTNIMPFIPAEGSVFENIRPSDSKEINELRKICGEELKQMYHCKQCRADAIGLLGEDRSSEFSGCSTAEDKKGCGSTDKAEKVYNELLSSSKMCGGAGDGKGCGGSADGCSTSSAGKKSCGRKLA